LEFNCARCIGCLVTSRSYQSKVNCCCTKQSLNQYGFTVSNFGAQPLISINIEIIQRFQNKYLRIIVNAFWHVTNDTLHHDLNIPYVRNEIKKLSQRYADRLEKHPNTLAIDLMSEAETSRRVRRKLPQDLCRTHLPTRAEHCTCRYSTRGKQNVALLGAVCVDEQNSALCIGNGTLHSYMLFICRKRKL